MAELQMLSPQVRQDIAAQIAQRGPQGLRFAAGRPPELGESFKVVQLSYDAVVHGQGPLAQRVATTGQWYHQIYIGPEAVKFARTKATSDAADAAHHVVEIARSDLPEALKGTIGWIDEHLKEDGQATLLIAPSYFLTAIWIHGPAIDDVVVAVRPEGMADLPVNERLTGDDFLKRLASSAPVEGLGAPGGIV